MTLTFEAMAPYMLIAVFLCIFMQGPIPVPRDENLRYTCIDNRLHYDDVELRTAVRKNPIWCKGDKNG